MSMQPRESIPNVGRRAQGRKTLFMLKGNGFNTDVTDVENDVNRSRQQLLHDSLYTCCSKAGDNGELLEPVSYDESVLSQPSHPYNRIIQRILHRHQAAERKESQELTGGHLTSRTERKYGPETAQSSIPYSTTRDHHPRSSDLKKPSLIDLRLSKPGLLRTERDDSVHKTKREDGDQKVNKRLWKPENELRLQWADILKADHCIVKDRYDLQLCDVSSIDERSVSHMSSTDDKSVSSLDLARGYLTDRGLIQEGSRAGSLLDDLTQSLDTTRSDPRGISCLPRLSRKRDLQPLDDVLDYFWVYQGMSRQLLDRDSPDDFWNRRFFKKKPTRLPPIYISTGRNSPTASSVDTTRKSETASSGSTLRKNEVTSSDGTSSGGLISQDVDTLREIPRREKVVQTEPDTGLISHQNKRSAEEVGTEPDCTLCSHQNKRSADSDLDSQPADRQIQRHTRGKCTCSYCHEADDFRKTLAPSQFENEDELPAKRVTLVVKVPVMTQESSCADLLETD